MTFDHLDSLKGRPSSRAALVRDQGVCASAEDEARIQRITNGISEALLKSPLPSLFDTEPAHFERGLISRAFADTCNTRDVS